jgi:hypothetical protein
LYNSSSAVPHVTSSFQESEKEMNGRNNKRQRLEEGQKDEPSEVDIRLSDELRGLPGGRKYAKAKDLTREILLEHAKKPKEPRLKSI